MFKTSVEDSIQAELLTLEELASVLRIGRSAAYDAARDGKLPVRVFRVGNRYRFSRREVDRLLNGQLDTRESDNAA